MTERKFKLTRVAVGDYLLPSNDGRTIWRFRKYQDGPSGGLIVDWPRDRTFWGVWRWAENAAYLPYVDTSVGAESRWEAYDLGMYATRGEAIEAALKVAERSR